jgi:tetratricopeptide (TPR) repeat protein
VTRTGSPCLDDDQVHAFLGGLASAAEAARIDDHIDACAACRGLLADAARTRSLASSSGVSVTSVPPVSSRSGGALEDRYVTLEMLGAGAMGVVYAAYDHKLHRRVALKLLRADEGGARGADARARLLREARALARLSHPNIVVVHDVGTMEDQVFMAMELVAGRTLGAWLRAAPRPDRRRILDVFIQAGRGLAAVHAAGLVHRDFKPDNVLVDAAGRARVTDFGLVRLALPDDPGAAPLDALPDAPTDEALLSRTGTLAGTPVYMAPEQLRRLPADARSDQFSFCVALYEALHGERPFAARTLGELTAAVNEGHVRPAPRESHVPAWLRAVVLRGLRVAPEERHASMDALCDALAADPGRARQRRLTWGAAAAFAAVAAVGIARAPAARGAVCKDSEQRLAGVWDAERKGAIQRAFAGTGAPGAEEAWRRVEQRLDADVARWAEMRTEACEATHVRGEQSQALLELRMQCLERHHAEVKALSNVLARADAGVTERALQAVDGLSKLSQCTPAEALRGERPPPRDEQTRSKMAELDAKAAEALALANLGKTADGLAVAQRAVEAARELHLAPALASKLMLRGRLENELGDHARAEATLYEAVWAAEAGKDDLSALHAWMQLMWVMVTAGTRDEEAMRLSRHAEAFIERISADEQEQAFLLNVRGVLLLQMGKLEEAAAHHQRALAVREKALGPQHLDVAASLVNLAVVRQKQGRYEEARRLNERVLAIREEALGPQHTRVAGVLNNLGSLLEIEGRHAEARQRFERALAIRERAVGPEHPEVAAVLVNLAHLQHALGEENASLASYQRALVILEKALGAEHPHLGEPLVGLSEVLAARRETGGAIQALQRAAAIAEKAHGPTHPDVAAALSALGALRAAAAPAEAIPLLDRALAIREAGEVPPEALAETRFALARALRQARRDRERAGRLAEQARDAYAALGPRGAADGRRVEAWLQPQAGPR